MKIHYDRDCPPRLGEPVAVIGYGAAEIATLGSGGALTHGKFAASLKGVTPKHMYEAMLTGPQSMPVFGDGTMKPQDKKEIIKYLQDIQKQPDPGGAGLGKVGPVTEGAVGWIFGLGSLIGAAVWLGAKAR